MLEFVCEYCCGTQLVPGMDVFRENCAQQVVLERGWQANLLVVLPWHNVTWSVGHLIPVLRRGRFPSPWAAVYVCHLFASSTSWC